MVSLHMRSGHVGMLMTFDLNPQCRDFLAGNRKPASHFSLLVYSSAMKREQVITAIKEAEKEPSKFLELVKKHVS